MKAKVDTKKKPPQSSSSDSSSESSSDEEIAVKAKVTSPVKPPVVSSSQNSQASVKSTTTRASAVITPKTVVTPKAGSNIPTKSVPANKFPKRAASSSSSSESSDSDAPPASQSKNKKQAVQPPQSTPKVNQAATNNSKTNNNVKPAAQTAAKAVPQFGKGSANTPKNVPTVTSPKIYPQSPSKTFQSQSQQTVAAAASPPVFSPAKQPSQVPITSSGDDSYSRVEPKKSVTNAFGSNCPHCGKEIEVKLKFS